MEAKKLLMSPVSYAISIAEKYANRINAEAFMDMLPDETEMCELTKFFQIWTECREAQKNTLQVDSFLYSQKLYCFKAILIKIEYLSGNISIDESSRGSVACGSSFP